MTLLSDGTCWNELDEFIRNYRRSEKFSYKRGYDDATLEAKRRAAVDWLREYSHTGWTLDPPREHGKA